MGRYASIVLARRNSNSLVLAYRCVPLHVVIGWKNFIHSKCWIRTNFTKFIPPSTTCKQATILNLNTANYLPKPDIMIRETLAKLQHLHAAQCLLVRCRTGNCSLHSDIRYLFSGPFYTRVP